MADIKKYRVDTDKGSYEVEVEMGPDPTSGTAQEAPGPSATDFLGNVGESGLRLIKGAGAGLKAAVTQNPLKTVGDMAGGLVERGKEYAHDLHPITAMEQAGDGHLLQALSNILPTEMMYRDPVGVASDALAVGGVVKGANALRQFPAKRAAAKAAEFNAQPLAKQMEKLPDTGMVDRTRTGGPVASPSTGINDLPLAQQQPLLDGSVPWWRKAASTESRQEAGAARPAGSPTGGERGPLNINDRPLFEQQRILEQTGVNRPVIDSGRRGADLPPSRDVAPTQGIAEELGVRPTADPLEGAHIGGRKLDLSSLPESARQRILDQLDPNRVKPEVSHAPPARAAAPVDAPPTLGDTRRLEEHGTSVAAQDPRFQLLSQEFGLDPSPSTVRDITGGPSRTPLRAEVAGMDRDFSRRIMDEKGRLGLESDDLSQMLQGMLLGHMVRGIGLPKVIGHTLNRAGGVIPSALGAAGAARLNHP